MNHPTLYTIEPTGSFDSSIAPELRRQVQAALTSSATLVILDCQGVSFMDSSGLGELILAYKSLKQAGIGLLLCAINEQVKTLLELTDLAQIFEVFPSRHEAEQSLLAV
ncbi:STAS domain-containing protein [Lyngbya confervoides]|uniref:Anti-sigma factor antagonist n=1 Tax=Lyngbya confervoides BDU141951 TaxID=1574623 RepID=A0ABD4T3V2_9CYAN|nr:STAS domain-containing protein [Lyngbya confervoides]MCM1983402.1 STAS domain-containing protein [Lyngbya confervoides BDU141951]